VILQQFWSKEVDDAKKIYGSDRASNWLCSEESQRLWKDLQF